MNHNKCPKCGLEWPHDSEQACCIEVYGACIKCKMYEVFDYKPILELQVKKRMKINDKSV